MTLIEACMNGLVLYSFRPDRPVDIVLVSERWISVASVGWWKTDWSLENGIYFYDATLNQVNNTWEMVRSDNVKASFEPPEEPDAELFLKNARLETDIDRDEYLKQLQFLRDSLGEAWYKQLDEWVAAVNQRPIVNSIEELKKRNTESRPVGIVKVTDQDGAFVDALAIDQRGNAATANETDWLEAIGSQWISYSDSDRPDTEDFLQWLSTQRPGGLNVESFRVVQEKGSVEVIAKVYAKQ